MNDITKKELKDAWNSVFPKSAVSVSGGALSPDTYYVKGYILSSKEFPNGYAINDPLSFMASVDEGGYKELSLSLTIAPPKDSHYAYGSVKIRKVSMKKPTIKKIIKRFEKIKAFIAANESDMVHDISGKL